MTSGNAGQVPATPPLRTTGCMVRCFTFLLLSLGACSSGYQEVKIVVDDFRFSPVRIDLQAGQSVHLVVRNQGRELHRFQSTLLSLPRVTVVSYDGRQPDPFEHGFSLAPGQRLELFLVIPPGVYHFRCPVKGHRGMKGMIVVQKTSRALSEDGPARRLAARTDTASS